MKRTGIINALHPAPMTVRRHRTRKRELVFVLQETPITLRRVDPEALGPALFAPRHRLHTGESWHPFEGALWYPLSGKSRDAFQPSPWEHFGVAEFEAFLRRERPWPEFMHTDVGQSFIRTPLIAGRIDRAPATRGIAWGEGGLGGQPVSEVHADGRPAAVPSLIAFMEERVVVAGDIVFVRMAPLAGMIGDLPVLQPFPRARAPSECKGAGMALGHRLDLFREAMAWENDMTVEDAREWIQTDLDFDRLAEVGSGSDAAVLVANFAATAAHQAYLDATWLGGYVRGGTEAALAEFWDLKDEVHAWGEQAALGLIDGADAARSVACAGRLSRAMKAACRSNIGYPTSVQYIDELVRRFEEFEWPHVPHATVPDADAEALAGLSM